MSNVCKFHQQDFASSSSTTGKGMKTMYVKTETKCREYKHNMGLKKICGKFLKN